ncbi:hypothetical protein CHINAEXTREME_05455 [Halobiforma lacisalsi AJ5]|uniref:Heme NO binding domain-containing protein n=1 Tax=Natronobacterium lacisalsi AJ5 TaxID=358396 RepID=M0LNZ6_NATLA|nr:heme NO-binding domain-containing protein [Halobiforma lacisalsi]APW97250.1 hypothetical protein CHINAEXTREME_05455 [Halobiforma lacisalsi AJ5]EMA33760.1 Heme NO binding domain-containing protein [Halobiforma lacisalsi AJ5]
MHGIVHKTLKEYVVDRAGEDAWNAVAERAGLESTLYLPVSRYDDADVDDALDALSTLADEDRRRVERDFGRTLAPELLSTFDAHVSTDGDLATLLTTLGTAYEELEVGVDDVTLPDVTGRRTDEGPVIVTYRSPRERGYCWLAYGILEGLAAALDADATVTKTDCAYGRGDGDGDGEDEAESDACRFRVSVA